ncbi:quinone oxidoreductase family protein [Pseudonocardia sp. CA-107938]|uniref:quinone oxidoreductase family protein n=1 Tax=Pseudonocardia sp. CA-107938 TaxID=3240021 RepID=UPI003D91A503
MKALVMDRFGGPEVLELREVPAPEPRPGHTLVRMQAIGLNYADVYRRRGDYVLEGEPPWVLGYEGAGVVEAADPAGSGPAVGVPVGFADSPFANGELVSVPTDRLIELPPGISAETAAAVLLQGLTADYLVRDSYPVASGDRVVVHAAAGGVGLLLVQLASAAGATVVGLASTEEKRRAVERAGAVHAVAAGPGWVDRVRDLGVLQDGAHVVYDSVGSTLAESLSVTRTGGTVVVFGKAGGPAAPIDPYDLMATSRRLVGGDLWNVLTSPQERRVRAARLLDAVATGALDVAIAGRFPLEQGAAAHELIESRSTIGKILLVPA